MQHFALGISSASSFPLDFAPRPFFDGIYSTVMLSAAKGVSNSLLSLLDTYSNSEARQTLLWLLFAHFWMYPVREDLFVLFFPDNTQCYYPYCRFFFFSLCTISHFTMHDRPMMHPLPPFSRPFVWFF